MTKPKPEGAAAASKYVECPICKDAGWRYRFVKILDKPIYIDTADMPHYHMKKQRTQEYEDDD